LKHLVPSLAHSNSTGNVNATSPSSSPTSSPAHITTLDLSDCSMVKVPRYVTCFYNMNSLLSSPSGSSLSLPPLF